MVESSVFSAGLRRICRFGDIASNGVTLASRLGAEGLPPDNWIIAMPDAEVARARIGIGRSNEALPLLRNAAERLRATFGEENVRVREIDAVIL